MPKQKTIKLLSILLLTVATTLSSCVSETPQEDDTIGLDSRSKVPVDGVPLPEVDENSPGEGQGGTDTDVEEAEEVTVDEPQTGNSTSSGSENGSGQTPRGGPQEPDDISETEPVNSGPSAADRDRLMNSVSVSPSVAYLDESTQFSMGAGSNVLNQWQWKYKFSSGSWRSAPNGQISTTFNQLGKQRLYLQASWDNVEIPFEHSVLVTVSEQWLNKKLTALINAVKSADASGNWSEPDRLVDELKPYFTNNPSFSIPEEGGGNNWQTFIDILYADIPFEDRFSKVADYQYDNATGLVSFMKVR
ncbi:MAG: hypothetical protein ACE362_02980 [Phaeodactylibacter xiamenensis]|uniref:Lipoprotein n=1 Tax=Phaeodactylibacter xiamenensis TaxID=1524460 RepID=A0A098S227_9BACT|nr:hypothetical protein [Phaeodactylibacter xiamenensis]KGE85818.1 hypothetical protein IX84_24600 [Phaeodactylibacter xiamenensis]MCR9051192.1 hypothetical protein [bacterium]